MTEEQLEQKFEQLAKDVSDFYNMPIEEAEKLLRGSCGFNWINNLNEGAKNMPNKFEISKMAAWSYLDNAVDQQGNPLRKVVFLNGNEMIAEVIKKLGKTHGDITIMAHSRKAV